jgi:hypothetical protein
MLHRMNPRTARRGAFSAALVASLLAPGAVCGQQPRPALVRVHVTDSSRVALGDVDLVVIRDKTEPVLFGRTGADGRFTFSFEPESASYEMAVRRVGYLQTSRRLQVSAGDTVVLEIPLARLPRALDTIRVTEKPLPLVRRPFVGAAEIAADKRSILSLGDVLGALRPEIAFQSFKCVSSASRGVRVVPGDIPRSHRNTKPPYAARVYINGKWFPPEFDPFNSIHAEHIEEVRYVNCLDNSIPGLPERAWASVYVVLKPGILWDYKRGSYEDPSLVKMPP